MYQIIIIIIITTTTTTSILLQDNYQTPFNHMSVLLTVWPKCTLDVSHAT